MKVYRGYNGGGDTSTPHLVIVTGEDSDDVAVLHHHVHHSPGGFSWGYGGSGPTELARCILWDHLGGEPARPCYMAFKATYVARWPQDSGWELTSVLIDRWLDHYYPRPEDRLAARQYLEEDSL